MLPGLLWRSGRDSNPRAAFDDNTISSRARYDLFDTTAYSLSLTNSMDYYTKIPRDVKLIFPVLPFVWEKCLDAAGKVWYSTR